MAQGIKKNIDATVGRQNQYLTAGTPSKNLPKDKGLQTPHKTSVHNVGPPGNVGISGAKGKNPGAG